MRRERAGDLGDDAVTTGYRRARIAVAVTFLTHAAVFATWAPRIPTIKESLNLSHDDLGLAFGIMAVGLLLGTRLTGRMEKRARTAKPIRLLMPVQCLALTGPAYATNLPTLCVALFFLGVLGGVVDVAMNAHAVAVERMYRRPIMSAFHGLWSGGMMGASAVASLVARYDVGLRTHFVVAAVVLAIASAPVLSWLLSADAEAAAQPPKPAEPTERANSAKRSQRPSASLLILIVLGVVGFGGFVTEGAILDWGAILLHEDRGASPSAAALGLTVFTGAMAVSRLTGDWFRARLGSVRLARLAATIGFVGLGIALLVDHPLPTLAGLTILGLGIGPLVPIVFSSAGNTPTNGHASALSIAVSAGYIGAIVGPMLIGFAAGRAGLGWALTIPLMFLAVTFFAVGLFVDPDRQSEPSEPSESADPSESGGSAESSRAARDSR